MTISSIFLPQVAAVSTDLANANRLGIVNFQSSIILSVGIALGLIAAGYAFYHALRIRKGAIATLITILGVATLLFDIALLALAFLPFLPADIISDRGIVFIFELLIGFSFLFILVGLIRFQSRAGY